MVRVYSLELSSGSDFHDSLQKVTDLGEELGIDDDEEWKGREKTGRKLKSFSEFSERERGRERENHSLT